ncbi:hypothetical protein MUN82_08855 [Hymenobacter aerilatus]|uniref:Uncharacterized protein n=1 Tax=Hymenobacter aerilatus TaxID=2932251 RepID=A0A8T9SY67_9BACT|nr:hypothetical protein [Hymenobacter aerilatus]UOR07192.1 hypothetical protein MUN82_08855 [Hymenobacter aerilatus]
MPSLPEETPAYLSNAEADVLCFAMRYALDRQTTAPSIVSDEIVRLWPRLQPWQQDQIQKELRHQSTYLKAWNDERWHKVLNLKKKE